MRKKIKLLVAAALALVVLAALTAAVGVWTVSGSGSGTAKALGSPTTVTINASTGTADLYPGFTQGDVYFTLTNTNPYGASFSSFSGASVTASSDPTNCPAANVTVSSSGSVAPAVTVGANTTSGQQSILNIVTMSGAAPNACQDVTFTIALTLSGVST